MPAAMSPLASPATSVRNSAVVTSRQGSLAVASLRRMATARGSRSARSKTTSARFAVGGISATAGLLYSRMPAPDSRIASSVKNDMDRTVADH